MSVHRRTTSVGLPSTPRARSFAPAQTRPDIPSRPPSAASERPPPSRYIPSRPPSSASERPPPSSYHYSRAPPLPPQAQTLRPHRSVGTLSRRPTGSARSHSLDRRAEPRDASYRAGPPPLPRDPRIGAGQPRGRAPTLAPAHVASRSDDYNAYRRREDLRHSDSSASSSGSEGFERSPLSAASSRTSIDEMEMEDKKDEKPPAGFGSSLWGNITGVASNLTISVSKAWSSNVATFSGEETPVGGESRLTRAMKAYHIEKARNPHELPDWLFDERERGIRSNHSTTVSASEKKMAQEPRPSDLSRSVTTIRPEQPLPTTRIARGPTLADRKAGSTSSAGFESQAGSEEHVTKSMSRLRELRDAKRRAKVRFDGDEVEEPANPPEPVYRPPPRSVPVQERAPPPTRPRANMAAPLGASLGVRGRQPSTRVGLPSGVRPVRI